jgi:hypothetical protein
MPVEHLGAFTDEVMAQRHHIALHVGRLDDLHVGGVGDVGGDAVKGGGGRLTLPDKEETVVALASSGAGAEPRSRSGSALAAALA